MKRDLNAFASAWGAVWSGDPPSTEDAFADPVRLSDTPAIPLARRVKMDDAHPYEAGALGLQLSRLRLYGLGRAIVDDARIEETDEGVRFRFRIGALDLKGRHAIQAKPDPIPTVDGAGGLLDLPEAACRPLRGGSDSTSGGNVTPAEASPWLDNAYQQRVTLAQSTSGQALLDKFAQHNDAFNGIFGLTHFTDQWSAGGVTQAMAGDTHVNTQPGATAVVNPNENLYNNNQQTYNDCAFVRQVLVATACNHLSTQSGDPYDLAAKDTVAFGTSVSGNTSNTSTNVNPMTADEVHSTVKSNEPPDIDVSDGDLTRFLGGEMPTDHENGSLKDWQPMPDSMRNAMQALREGLLRDRAENAAILGEELFKGACHAALGEVEVVVELRPSDVAGGLAQVVSAQVTLPAFDLEIDDSAWSGDAGEVARERIDRIHFLRSLLHSAITERLRRIVGPATAAAMRLMPA